MSELGKNKTVREVFREQFKSEHPPRDSIFKDMKTRVNKESNPDNKPNNADEIQLVLNMTSIPNFFLSGKWFR